MLLIKADDHLRLDSAVTQPGNNGLLDFRYRSGSGGNLAGVGNVNGALLINGLRRQIDEVPRTSARRLPRRKQATRGRFKNRYIKDVAHTDDLVGLGAFIGEFALERDHIG